MATTAADFKYFKSQVEYWVRYFGLTQWSISVAHFRASESSDPSICEDGGKVVAWVGLPEWGNQTTTVCLNKEYDNKEKLEKHELSRSAFHEVGHIMLRNLQCLAVMRCGVTEEMIDAEVHNVITILENALYKVK